MRVITQCHLIFLPASIQKKILLDDSVHLSCMAAFTYARYTKSLGSCRFDEKLRDAAQEGQGKRREILVMGK
jgi:hypothetical protein